MSVTLVGLVAIGLVFLARSGLLQALLRRKGNVPPAQAYTVSSAVEIPDLAAAIRQYVATLEQRRRQLHEDEAAIRKLMESVNPTRLEESK